MAFAEDLTEFLSTDDFAVLAVFGSPTQTVKVIKDAPGLQVGDIISDEHSILGTAAELAGLKRGDSITVDGVAYKVREPFLQDDGKMKMITLSKT